MYLKKLLGLLVVIGINTTTQAQPNKNVVIAVENNSALNFKNKVIEIPWNLVENGDKAIDTSKLIITDAVTNKQLVFQLISNGMSTIQKLLVETSVKAFEKKKLLIGFGKRLPFTTKTFGRYVPERKEDFAWENDKIAFRMYGKELEKTPKEMGLGIDVWVKRTERMILNERYKRGEYHIVWYSPTFGQLVV